MSSLYVAPELSEEEQEKQNKKTATEKTLNQIKEIVDGFKDVKDRLLKKESHYDQLLRRMEDSVNEFNDLVKQQSQRYEQEVESWKTEKTEVDSIRAKEKQRLDKANRLLDIAYLEQHHRLKQSQRDAKKDELNLMLSIKNLSPENREFLDRIGITKKGSITIPDFDNLTLEQIRNCGELDPETRRKFEKMLQLEKERIKNEY